MHVSEKNVEKMPTVDWIDVIETHACYPNLHALYIRSTEWSDFSSLLYYAHDETCVS